jgi:hypothetical protein
MMAMSASAGKSPIQLAATVEFSICETQKGSSSSPGRLKEKEQALARVARDKTIRRERDRVHWDMAAASVFEIYQ